MVATDADAPAVAVAVGCLMMTKASQEVDAARTNAKKADTRVLENTILSFSATTIIIECRMLFLCRNG